MLIQYHDAVFTGRLNRQAAKKREDPKDSVKCCDPSGTTRIGVDESLAKLLRLGDQGKLGAAIAPWRLKQNHFEVLEFVDDAN